MAVSDTTRSEVSWEENLGDKLLLGMVPLTPLPAPRPVRAGSAMDAAGSSAMDAAGSRAARGTCRPRAGFRHGRQLPAATARPGLRGGARPGAGGTDPLPPPQRRPELRDRPAWGRREPLPAFCSGLGRPRPRPRLPPGAGAERGPAGGSGGQRRRQGLWDTHPLRRPDRPPGLEGGAAGGGRGERAQDPAPRRQPPAASGRRGPGPGEPLGGGGGAEPTGREVHRGRCRARPPSALPPPPTPPRATGREHARCASRAPRGLLAAAAAGPSAPGGAGGGGGGRPPRCPRPPPPSPPPEPEALSPVRNTKAPPRRREPADSRGGVPAPQASAPSPPQIAECPGSRGRPWRAAAPGRAARAPLRRAGGTGRLTPLCTRLRDRPEPEDPGQQPEVRSPGTGSGTIWTRTSERKEKIKSSSRINGGKRWAKETPGKDVGALKVIKLKHGKCHGRPPGGNEHLLLFTAELNSCEKYRVNAGKEVKGKLPSEVQGSR